MVPEAPPAALLLELELEPELLLELLLLEPQAATPSDARTATATALMRLVRNVFSFNRGRRQVCAVPDPLLLFSCEPIIRLL